MKFTRRFAICAGAIEKKPIEDFNPPLNKEEVELYKEDYEVARIYEKHGNDPNEMKLGFSATWDWDDD